MLARGLRMRDRRDTLTIAGTLAHAALLLLAPSLVTVGLLLWWNANALSHQHVHRRFFSGRALDAAFSAWLTALMGVPQRLWRARHLAHHAERPWRFRLDWPLAAECALVLALWTTLLAIAPGFFFASYLPGLALGRGLCVVHGHYEHAGGTTSCYGRAWNWLFFNDGYHAEHHAHPQAHVFDLPRHRVAARVSRWPPVLRWLDAQPSIVARALDALEYAVLRCRPLQALVLHAHRRALRALLRDVPAPRRVIIVGGGLFPRSAILARELWPTAQVTVLDAAPTSLTRARRLLPRHVHVVCGRYIPGEVLTADLVFLPLALCGDRARAYASPPAALCVVHDWLWQAHGDSRVVAWWLGKRVNLVCGTTRHATGSLHLLANARAASRSCWHARPSRTLR